MFIRNACLFPGTGEINLPFTKRGVPRESGGRAFRNAIRTREVLRRGEEPLLNTPFEQKGRISY